MGRRVLMGAPLVLVVAMIGALLTPGDASGEEGGYLVVTKATDGGFFPGSLGFAFEVDCSFDGETVFEFPDGEYLVLGLNDSQIPGQLPIGSECTVTEVGTWNHEADWEGQDPGSLEGWTTEPAASQTIIIEPGFNELTFTNRFDIEGGLLVIEKVVEGPFDGNFGFIFDIACTYEGQVVAATNPEHPEAFNPGFAIAFGGQPLPVGTECTVEETGTWNHDSQESGPLAPWQVVPAGPVGIAIEPGFNTVTFTNSLDLETGVLVIEKVVEGPFDGSVGFAFDISCTRDGQVIAESDPDYPEVFGEGFATPFGGQPLPVATECTVEETGTWNHETQELGPLAPWQVVPSGPVGIAIEPGFNVVTFTNTSTIGTGSLVITKVVQSPEMFEAFAFNVECLDGDQLVYAIPDPEDPNGEPFVSGNGTQVASHPLPVGTVCTVEEIGLWNDGSVDPLDGWTTDPASRIVEVTIEEGLTAAVFTNTRDDFEPPQLEPTGTLVIDKAVDGRVDLGPTGFAFDVTCEFDGGVVLETAGDYSGSSAGPGSTTPFGGPPLPVGTVCLVEEVGTFDFDSQEFDPDGLDEWTTVPASRMVEVTIGEGFNTASFVNTPPDVPTGQLVIDKVVEGPFDGSFGFAFTVQCWDGEVFVGGTSWPDDPNDVFVANGPQVFWQPIPIGATCLVEEIGLWNHELPGEEALDPDGLDEWTTVPASRMVEVDIVDDFNVATFVNTKPGAALTITKLLEGAPEGPAFAFDVTCVFEDEVVASTEGEPFGVEPGTSAMFQLGLPPGTECTVIEVGWFDEFGLVDDLSEWEVIPGLEQTIVLEEPIEYEVVFTNRVRSTLLVEKIVEVGPDYTNGAEDVEFTFEVACLPEGDNGTIERTLRGGEHFVLEVGRYTECTVTETAASVGSLDEWTTLILGDGEIVDRSITIPIQPGENGVTFVNSDIDFPILEITKEVVDGPDDARFLFEVECFDPQGGPLFDAPPRFDLGDGESVGGPLLEIPFGSTCTVAEVSVYPVPDGGETLEGWSASPSTIQRFAVVEGQDVSLTFVNRPIPDDASISLTKTVGTVPGVCAPTSSITAGPGDTVYYCYRVTNTGDVPFALHDLVDDRLGTLLSEFPFLLAPGASTSVISDPVVIEGTVTNTATWRAFNSAAPALQSPDVFRDAVVGQGGQHATATASATVNCVAPNPYLRACLPSISD